MAILRRFRALRFNLKRRLGITDRPTLVVYSGFVENGRARLKGRVLEDEGVFDAPHTDSALRNLWLTFKRYETDEIGGARIAWSLGGIEGKIESGPDGYFEIEVAAPPAEAGKPWAGVEATLVEARGYDFEPMNACGEVRLVSERSRFGIISDIDDTIVHTGAFKILRHWRIVTANSPEARAAFPGVSHFYRALCEGEDGPETNPVFYVSSSPWNLFDLFERFMALKGIPKGPMLLRNLSADALGWLLRRHANHKDEAIDRLMAAYPDLPFVLIGDSGQKDATVYAAAVKRHPGRVLAVHIHDVRPSEAPSEVEDELDRIRSAGVPATIGRSLASAAELAERAGLVKAGTLELVRAEIASENLKESRFGRFPLRAGS